MIIAVGSTNPVKINAVTVAASATWPQVRVEGVEVGSGVSEQPMSDEETRLGAQNRAKIVFEQMSQKLASENANNLQKSPQLLAIGLEGGVFQGKDNHLWSTVWAAVWDNQQLYEANGARFKVPSIIADPILAGGEMGPILSELFAGADIKRTNGAIGIITQNFVDRTEEYTAIAKLALGLWYGREWEKTINH